MAIKPIRAHGFRGMNNLPQMPAKLLDDERRITPSFILNAEVTDGGRLRKRGGYALTKSLSGCHSLAGNERGLSVMLCVADGVLYRVEGVIARALTTVSGPRTQVNYQEVNNLVYMSSPYWSGVYDLLKDSIRAWGLMPPLAPDIAITSGNLPPGTYVLCYTRTEDGRLSGNGPLTTISWDGGSQGILLRNLPADGQAWITHPNGQKLFLAQVDEGVITGQVPQAKPLPSFMVTPPPYFTHFCHAFGRIWGVSGKNLHYSFPYQYEWFRHQSGDMAWVIPFLEDLVMVAPVTKGLFVNSLTSTWFLEGTSPENMSLSRIGDGAVPGTLVMAQIQGDHLEIARKIFWKPSPVWVSRNGFVAGTHTGHLVHMTEDRLRLNPRSQGAVYCLVKNGITRLVVSIRGIPVKPEEDEDLMEILNNGKLFEYES